MPDTTIDLEHDVAVVVTAAVERVVSPLLERLALLEQQVARDAKETRATVATVSSALAVVGMDVAALHERVAVAEVTQAPAGPPGPPGPPGQDGADGSPGAPGLRYRGVFTDGQTYEPGDLVTWAGSAWYCHDTTVAKPGEGATRWQLMVKRGRDGKDRA